MSEMAGYAGSQLRMRDVYRYGLFALLLAVLLIFLILPIVLSVAGGFVDVDGHFTLAYVTSIFKDPLLVQGLINALLIGACTTLGCLALSLPMALIATRYNFPGKGVVGALVLVPLILPPFVGAIGLRFLLGRFGAVNAMLGGVGLISPDEPGINFLGGGFWAVVLMEVLHLYPILYLNVTAAMANLDPALDEAALNLGAGRLRRFFRLTLPLIMPGIFAGGTIVFIWSFTELGTPLMFDYYTVTPVQIFWGITELESNPQTFALVVVMLTVALLMYVLGKFFLGGRAYEMQSKASIASQVQKLPPIAGWLALLFFTGVTALAILPHIGVVLASVTVDGTWYRSVLPAQLTANHYVQALTHPLAEGAIRNSLMYSITAMIVCVAMGLAIAYLAVRVKIRGGGLLDALAMLPLAVPGLVMAFGYVAMSLHWPFGDDGPLGWMFSVLGANPQPFVLLVIAYSVRRLPYIVRSASAGLEQTSGQLEEAALNLGASLATSIRRVVVPLIMANLIAGGVLVFAFSMLEVSDSLILAQKENAFPITKAIFTLFTRLGDGPYIASAMGVWGMALLTVTLVGASVLMGRKLGAIFRV